jgi:acetate kinase
MARIPFRATAAEGMTRGHIMGDAILVLDVGSSSVKFSLFEGHVRPSRKGLICDGEFDGIGHRVHFVAKDNSEKSLADRYLPEGATHEDTIATLLSWVESQFPNHRLVAAGHRVVHGGLLYSSPVRIDSSDIDELHRLIPLVPLHQPHNLAAIAAISKLHPELPQVACFDTAFHRTQPEVTQLSRCPARSRQRVSVATDSTGCPTSISPVCCPMSSAPSLTAASWWPISAAEPACARCTSEKAWRRP